MSDLRPASDRPVGAVGVVGLGNIGTYFTSRLRKAEYAPTVYDVDDARMTAAVERGAVAAGSAREVTEASRVTLLCLPGDPAVEAAMDGPDGVLGALRPGQVVVDTGTTRPETDIRYEEQCRARQAGFLDAPITFRAEGIIMMAAGDEATYEIARPVLECLSYKVGHVGPIGRGQLIKQVNQMMIANRIAIAAEAIAYCRAVDLDPAEVSDYLELEGADAGLKGLAGVKDYAAGGQLNLHYKDLLYILETAHNRDINIPLTSAVHEIFKATRVHGDPSWMQYALVTYWQMLNRP